MRRAVAWFLGGLPFDTRSRRAIDETLLDWEGEATTAQTFWEATGAEAHGVAAVLRVAALSVAREAIEFGWIRGLWRRFAVAASFVMVLALYDGWFQARPTRAGWIPISLSLVPLTLVQVMPATSFLAIAWRRRASEISVGAIALAVVVIFAFIHWVVPFSNQAFREFAAGPAITSTYVPSLMTSVGWACYCAAIVALASATAKAGFLQSWWWLPAGFVAAHLTLLGALQVTHRVLLAFDADGVLRPGIATLTLAAVLASLALALERRGVNASRDKVSVEGRA